MQHEIGKNNQMQSSKCGRKPLIITHQSPKAGRPREGALDDPAPFFITDVTWVRGSWSCHTPFYHFLDIESLTLSSDLRYPFGGLLAAAGLKHMKFHVLRHNASLILRRLKIDPVVRMEMLGHTRLDMTDGVYGHTTQKMHREAAEEIDRLFKREEKEE